MIPTSAVKTVSPASFTRETLVVRYWLKHFLSANSNERLSADEKLNANGVQKLFQPTPYDRQLLNPRSQLRLRMCMCILTTSSHTSTGSPFLHY